METLKKAAEARVRKRTVDNPFKCGLVLIEFKGSVRTVPTIEGSGYKFFTTHERPAFGVDRILFSTRTRPCT